MDVSQDALWTARDLAKFLGVSVRTVWGWVQQDRLPVLRLSPRTVRFDPQAVRQWIAKQAKEGSQWEKN